MKFTMDEAMKHRIVGIAVIVSIALVFVPAMIKKNNQRLEEKRIAVELPAKPPQPQVAEVDESKVFAETKVAHVDLDTQQVLSQTQEQAKQHVISEPESIQKSAQSGNLASTVKPVAKAKVHAPVSESNASTSNISKQASKTHPTIEAKKSLVVKPVKQAKSNPSPSYSVQVGVFSEVTNAQSFQQQLSKQGYQSRVVRTIIRGKPGAKVLVGHYASAEAAKKIKIKLAEQRINGFVTREVG